MSDDNFPNKTQEEKLLEEVYSSKKKKVRPHPDDEENIALHPNSKKKKVEHKITNSVSKSKSKLTQEKDQPSHSKSNIFGTVSWRPSLTNITNEKNNIEISSSNLKMNSRATMENKENTDQKTILKDDTINNKSKSPDNALRNSRGSNQNQKSYTNLESNKSQRTSKSVTNQKSNKTTQSTKSVTNQESIKKSRSSKSVDGDDNSTTLQWEEVKRGKSPGVRKFKCTAQLMEWAKNDILRSELDKRNTEALKVICQENGVLRSGPKYELISRLMENAEKGIRKMLDDNLQAEADAGNKRSEVELTFSKFKSFEASMNHASKMIKKMEELPDSEFKEKLDFLSGISRGVDSQLLIAITGPKCGKYNGKYDEIGIEGNEEIAKEWLRFLENRNRIGLDLDQLDQYIKASQGIDKCVPYGFDTYFDIIDDDVRKLFKDDELKLKMWIASRPERPENNNNFILFFK
jgi:myosin heavy subunit